MSLNTSCKSFTYFMNMVDRLVLEEAPNDPELAAGIKWLNDQAQQKGLTFYEMTFQILYKHDLTERAANWNDQRKHE